MTKLAYAFFLAFARRPGAQLTRLTKVPARVERILGSKMDDVFSWSSDALFMGLRRVSKHKVLIRAFDPKLPTSYVHTSVVPCDRALPQWVSLVFADLGWCFSHFHNQKPKKDSVLSKEHDLITEQKEETGKMWQNERMLCRRVGVERMLSKVPTQPVCSFTTLRRRIANRRTFDARVDLSVSDDA